MVLPTMNAFLASLSYSATLNIRPESDLFLVFVVARRISGLVIFINGIVHDERLPGLLVFLCHLKHQAGKRLVSGICSGTADLRVGYIY